MTPVPIASTFTSAPLRHRLRIELDAPGPEVWSLVANHERVPEYSQGIERVTLTRHTYARVSVISGDLSIVTVAATPQGTMFTWDQYYDHADLPMIRASYDEGITDIGESLLARFGGRVVERFVDGPLHHIAESR